MALQVYSSPTTEWCPKLQNATRILLPANSKDGADRTPGCQNTCVKLKGTEPVTSDLFPLQNSIRQWLRLGWGASCLLPSRRQQTCLQSAGLWRLLQPRCVKKTEPVWAGLLERVWVKVSHASLLMSSGVGRFQRGTDPEGDGPLPGQSVWSGAVRRQHGESWCWKYLNFSRVGCKLSVIVNVPSVG